MHDLDQIEEALAKKRLDHRLCEQCAQDLLTEVYPGLSPIPGGTDWGRDADIHHGASDPPVKLLATTARTLDGVRKNMLAGIRSMQKHGIVGDHLVLANPASLSQLQRNRLANAARKRGFNVIAIYDRGFFASRLRRDGEWRSRLLGLSAEPISLSRVPRELAESPWRELPLVGRSTDLIRLAQATEDAVIVGKPGTGKTRLLMELPDTVFVDRDAEFGRLADDLRWLQPKTVVVDDAAPSEALLRRLLQMRRSEPDVLGYRLLVVCWPDEVGTLRTWLPNVEVIELELLERSEIDETIQAMGITNELARAEILDQAEGRPGWAVTLGDLLLHAQDADSLLNGSALLGQIENYLRRAGVPDEAFDLLACVAALGYVAHGDLAHLAEEIGVTQAETRSLLTRAARSSLIDVETPADTLGPARSRRYTVRPPMLARVLVAERSYRAEVPSIDLRALAERWPAALPALAEAAIDSASLSDPGARTDAEELYRAVIAAPDVDWDAKIKVAKRFAQLDDEAAREVLALLRVELDQATSSDDVEDWQLEPLTDAAWLIAGWHQSDEAVTLLLDAALGDKRPLNSYPGHPLRKLDDLVHGFHPNLPIPTEHRYLVARVLNDWFEPSDEEHWRVYGHVVENLLSLTLRSSRADVTNPSAIRITEGVVSAAELRRIYEDIWPALRERLTTAPPGTLRHTVDAAEQWLHVGGGHDMPFGRNHPQTSIVAAQEYGTRLLHDVAELAAAHQGLRAAVQHLAETFAIELDRPEAAQDDAFFRVLDRLDDSDAIQELERDIGNVVQDWISDDPEVIARRLVDLREQLGFVPHAGWPDRIQLACRALAPRVTDPLSWVDAAREAGLFPRAEPFLTQALADTPEFGADRLTALLTVPEARWSVMRQVLTRSSLQHDIQIVVAALEPADYGLLEALFLERELPPGRAKALLVDAPGEAAAAAAAAMFAMRPRDGNEWSPEPLEAEWSTAIENLEPNAVGLPNYEASELTAFLAQQYPQILMRLVERLLDAAIGSGESAFAALPHGMWQSMSRLPNEHKTALWQRYTQPAVRFVLGPALVGADTDWLEEVIDTGVMTPEQALGTYVGWDPHPPIAALARLLVPRGVASERIAGVAVAGWWMGEDSDRYESLRVMYETMSHSVDPSEVAVGRAGVTMFTEARDRAREQERRGRIRGEL